MDYQKKVVPIPKSGNSERIIANSKIFDFNLCEKDMDKIDQLNGGESTIQKRERIRYLLEMLWKQKYNKRIIMLISDALVDKVRYRINYT